MTGESGLVYVLNRHVPGIQSKMHTHVRINRLHHLIYLFNSCFLFGRRFVLVMSGLDRSVCTDLMDHLLNLPAGTGHVLRKNVLFQ